MCLLWKFRGYWSSDNGYDRQLHANKQQRFGRDSHGTGKVIDRVERKKGG